MRILALGDSIVNDTMRSGWVALLQEAYPNANIEATVYVRGGGGCQHYRGESRLQKNVLPRNPNLVLIGGISQRNMDDFREVIHQLRGGDLLTGFLQTSDLVLTTFPLAASKLRLSPGVPRT